MPDTTMAGHDYSNLKQELIEVKGQERITQDRVLILEQQRAGIEAALQRIFEKLSEIADGKNANCIKHSDRLLALEKIASENKARLDGKASRANIAALWSVVAGAIMVMFTMWMNHLHGAQ